jgi:hypothetical protein
MLFWGTVSRKTNWRYGALDYALTKNNFFSDRTFNSCDFSKCPFYFIKPVIILNDSAPRKIPICLLISLHWTNSKCPPEKLPMGILQFALCNDWRAGYECFLCSDSRVSVQHSNRVCAQDARYPAMSVLCAHIAQHSLQDSKLAICEEQDKYSWAVVLLSKM